MFDEKVIKDDVEQLHVDYDSQILEDFEDFIDVNTILENTKVEYEKKFNAKQN